MPDGRYRLALLEGSRTMRGVVVALIVAGVSAVAPASAGAMGSPNVAALQVALHANGVYEGTIDGLPGPATEAAIRRFQRRARLAVDGVVGPRTRRALGRLARPRLGSRLLLEGQVGWDVAALQFELAWHGFPSGAFDGVFGSHLEAAVRRFQRFARIPVDGIAGPLALRALRRPPPTLPLRLEWPVAPRISSPFGPRGDGFHPGIDLVTPFGTSVHAARSGTVVFAGWDAGYGQVAVLRHRSSVTTWYAHLSRIFVRPGSHVGAGAVIGRVGRTGETTGPHLHFEARLRGAAVDPRPALG